MKAERNRLKRWQRLERMREIAKRAAAIEAAEAETALAQLALLSEHAAALAGQYGARSGETNGAALRHLHGFARALAGISASTASDADRARTVADARQQDLASAERSRSTVAEHAARKGRELARRETAVSLVARRGFGTGLE